MIRYFDGISWRIVPIRRDFKQRGAAIIACPGPSLQKIDTSSLRGPGRTVIGINTSYPKVIPDYWIGLDNPLCYDRKLLFEPFNKIFRVQYADTDWYNIKLHSYYNTYFTETVNIKYDQFYAVLNKERLAYPWINNTITYALGFALSLGFREIYLIGADFDKKLNYFDNRILSKEAKKWNTNAYKYTKEFFKYLIYSGQNQKIGLNLYSASPISKLNEFMPYKSLDSLYKEIEQTLPSPGELKHCTEIHPREKQKKKKEQDKSKKKLDKV